MKRCTTGFLIFFCIVFLGLQTASADEVVVVDEGDTCWDISEGITGEGWRYPEFYQANASVIEEGAKSRGLASSESCHWIFPGTSLQNVWSTPEAVPTATTVAAPIVIPTPLSTRTPTVTPTTAPIVFVPIVTTSTPVVSAAGNSDGWPWWVFPALVVVFTSLLAYSLRKSFSREQPVIPEAKKEEKVFRPTRQEMLDATKTNSRFGSYSAERHKQLVIEFDQKAASVAAALRSFGSVADETTRQKIMEAPREQLRQQQLLTAWVLQSMGLLNSDGTVTLYRGFRDEVVARDLAGSGRVSRVSSFTLNRSTAQSFDGGGVIVARVPIELIAGSYLTCSYPHKSECEVTIMPGQVNGARYYKSHEVPESTKAPVAPIL